MVSLSMNSCAFSLYIFMAMVAKEGHSELIFLKVASLFNLLKALLEGLAPPSTFKAVLRIYSPSIASKMMG